MGNTLCNCNQTDESQTSINCVQRSRDLNRLFTKSYDTPAQAEVENNG